LVKYKLREQVKRSFLTFNIINYLLLLYKLVLGWPRPNATNDEANKWGDLVYGVPEA